MAMLFYALDPLKLPSPNNIKAKQQQQQQQQQQTNKRSVCLFYIYVLKCHATYVLKNLWKVLFRCFLLNR